jgi:hypothetical protein
MKQPDKQITKKVLLMLNGKSSGKTLFLVHLVRKLIQLGVNPVVIEGDITTMGISNFYRNLRQCDVTTKEGLGQLLSDIQKSMLRLYCLDSPAAKAKEMLAMLRAISKPGVDYRSQTGIEFVIITPVTCHDDSFYQAQLICSALADHDLKIILALNHDPVDVTAKYQTAPLKVIMDKMISTGQARLISMPQCKNYEAIQKMQELGKDALEVQGILCSTMQPFDQADLNGWYQELAKELSKIIEIIIPEGLQIRADTQTPEEPIANHVSLTDLKKARARMTLPGEASEQ